MVVPAGGVPCRCGNTGCLETLISEAEIVRQAKILATRRTDSILATRLAQGSGPLIERIFEAARMGDEHTQMMLKERAHYMGLALANLVNTINPDVIMMGGLFVAGQDLLLPPTGETMRQHAFAGLGDSVRLQITTFGPKVGVIGAAGLALDHFFYRQGIPSTSVSVTERSVF